MLNSSTLRKLKKNRNLKDGKRNLESGAARESEREGGHPGLWESRRRGWKHVRKSQILTSPFFASIVLPPRFPVQRIIVRIWQHF
ncbi:hypothetical protein KM043_013302 [Ampulex compressa]|nr:hypothetical protein KM043_013302 [Ampulex compressa]